MKKANKNWLTGIVIIATIILLLLLFRRNPKFAEAIKTVENALPFSLPQVLLPSGEPINIDIDLDGYTPHDYPLPDLPDYHDSNGNRGTSCNFCLQSRVQIVPPSPPVKAAPIYTPIPEPRISFGAQPPKATGVPHYSVTGYYLGNW